MSLTTIQKMAFRGSRARKARARLPSTPSTRPTAWGARANWTPSSDEDRTSAYCAGPLRRTKTMPSSSAKPASAKDRSRRGAPGHRVGDVPERLRDAASSLDMARVVAGTSTRQFEERLSRLIEDTSVSKTVISSWTRSTPCRRRRFRRAMAAKHLKPPLARGELQVVGIPQPQEYTNPSRRSPRTPLPVHLVNEPPSAEDAVRSSPDRAPHTKSTTTYASLRGPSGCGDC